MRRLVVWNLTTLDGYFEGAAPWDLRLHEYAWGEEMEAFSLEQGAEIGTLLFGRRTYEGMAAHWTSETGAIAEMMNGLDKAVASRTLAEASWRNSRVLAGDVPEAVRALKAEPGKDVYVFGSAELTDALLRARLVDEYRLGIAPVVLGGGNPLFKPAPAPLPMRLKDTRVLATGAIIAFFEPRYPG